MLFTGFYMQRALKKGVAYVGKRGISSSIKQYLQVDNIYIGSRIYSLYDINCYGSGYGLYLVELENYFRFDILSKLQSIKEFSEIFNIHTIFYNKREKSVKGIMFQVNPSRYDFTGFKSLEVLIAFLKILNKLYDANLIFSEYDANKYFSFITKTFSSTERAVVDLIDFLIDFCEKENKASLQYIFGSIIKQWCKRCARGDISSFKSAYDFAPWMTPELFKALKDSNDNVDFLYLLENLKERTSFTDNNFGDKYYFDELTYFGISPKTWDVEIDYLADNLDKQTLDANIARYNTIASIMNDDIVPYSFTKRVYNSQMQPVGFKLEKMFSESKLQKYDSSLDIHKKVTFIRAFVDLYNRVRFKKITFTKNLNLIEDFVFVENNLDEVLLCYINNLDIITTMSDSENPDHNEYFWNVLFETLIQEATYTYDADKDRICYNNISVINYLSFEVVREFNGYLIALCTNTEYKSSINLFSSLAYGNEHIQSLSHIPIILSEGAIYPNITSSYEENGIRYVLNLKTTKNIFFPYLYHDYDWSSIEPLVKKILAMNAKYILVNDQGYINELWCATSEKVVSIENILELPNITEKDILSVLIKIFNDFIFIFDNSIKTIAYDKYKNIVVDSNFDVYYNGKLDCEVYNIKAKSFAAELIKKYREHKNCTGSSISTILFEGNHRFSLEEYRAFLKSEYDKLDSYCEKHDYWYSSTSDTLCRFCYPGSVAIDVEAFIADQLAEHIYSGNFYNLYSYKNEMLILVDISKVDIEYLEKAVFKSQNEQDKLIRDTKTHEVIGYMSTICAEGTKLNHIALTKNELANMDLKWLLGIFIKVFTLIKELGKIRCSVNMQQYTDFFEQLFMIITSDKQLSSDCILNQSKYIRPKFDYEEKDIFTIMKEILLYILEIRSDFSYLISVKKINKLTNTNELIEYISKVHDNYSDVCKLHNIWYNSKKYAICPKCCKNADSVALITPSSFGKEEKKGGEALIYDYGKDGKHVLKLYRKDKDGNYLVDITQKSAVINAWLDQKSQINSEISNKGFSLVLPTGIAVDKNSKEICGFMMPKIINAKPISLLMDIEYAEVNNMNKEDILKILINLGEALSYLESKGWYIGDFNGGNVLFSKDNHKIAIIDTDSLGGVIGNEPNVFVESYLDPLANFENGVKMTISTDYYTFALISFAALTGLHPFGGVYREDKKIVNMVERMKRKISVLGDHNIVIPKSIFPWDWMSLELKEIFLSIFEKNERVNILPQLKAELVRLRHNSKKKLRVKTKNQNMPQVSKETLEEPEKVTINLPKAKILVDANVALNVFNENYYMANNGEVREIATGNKLVSVQGELKSLYHNKSKTKFVFCSEKNAYFYYTKKNQLQALDLPSGNINSMQVGDKVILSVDFVICVIDFSDATINVYERVRLLAHSKIKFSGVFTLAETNCMFSDTHKVMYHDVVTNKELIITTNSDCSEIEFYEIKDEDAVVIQNFVGDKEQLVFKNISQNAVLYNGIFYYPLDKKIGAINIHTKNFKTFDCEVCNIYCKLIRVQEGFYIIDTRENKLYEFFSM